MDSFCPSASAKIVRNMNHKPIPPRPLVQLELELEKVAGDLNAAQSRFLTNVAANINVFRENILIMGAAR